VLHLREKDNLEDTVADGIIILKRDFKDIGWEGVAWMTVTQDKVKWSHLLQRVANLQVP
jgi:hypothetical protein